MLTAKRALRRGVMLAVAVGVVSLAACETIPERDDNSLDPRFAGPCERLMLVWPAEAETLDAALGHSLRSRNDDVELHIVRCASTTRRQQPLVFAYVAIAVHGEDVPVVVTSVPNDGWWAMPTLWAEGPAGEVLTAMGYAVETADITFELDGEGRVSANIETGEGDLSIAAAAVEDSAEVAEDRALITDSALATAAFFGSESFRRQPLQLIDEGAGTLLSDFGLVGPPGVTLDRDLTSERIYWRLPK